jgi:hypothetical protein
LIVYFTQKNWLRIFWRRSGSGEVLENNLYVKKNYSRDPIYVRKQQGEGQRIWIIFMKGIRWSLWVKREKRRKLPWTGRGGNIEEKEDKAYGRNHIVFLTGTVCCWNWTSPSPEVHSTK